MKYLLSFLAGLALGVAATVLVMAPLVTTEQEAEARFLAEARKYFDEQFAVKKEVAGE